MYKIKYNKIKRILLSNLNKIKQFQSITILLKKKIYIYNKIKIYILKYIKLKKKL